MPVGGYTKEEIREMAAKMNLPVAHKPDSQDICFVPDGDYASFIEKTADQTFPQGNFVLADGTIVGRHNGIIHYVSGRFKGAKKSLGKNTLQS